jgi:vacuolar-type H+-ATPase subunit H
MSDVSSGARAPDGPLAEPAYPATTYPATAEAGGSDSTAGQVAGRAKETATDVKDTAKEQAQRVGSEARSQARNVASDVRDRVGHQARSQNDKLVGSIRQTADQLDEMRGDRTDSPAATVVSRVADGGRQLADYLDRNGPEGVLREVQDFARRRPGAFLATALAAGFVVGRLGKGVAKADSDAGGGKPDTDSFVSTGGTDTSAGYAPGPGASTEYAATGTGTPVVVDEQPGGPR